MSRNTVTLRMSRLGMAAFFLHRHTLAVVQGFGATIQAVEGASLPRRNVITATAQQAQDERAGPQHMMHGCPPFGDEDYCHIAGSVRGLVSNTLHSCPAATSKIGRASRARPIRGLRAWLATLP